MAKVSAGLYNSVARKDIKMIRRERTYTEKMNNIFHAWKAGKDPWITLPNTDPSKTNKKFVSVKTNSLWGNPKYKNKTPLESN